MANEWMSAAQAFALVSEAIGNSRATAQTICARASAGMVRARAKRFIAGGLPEDDADIPAIFWCPTGSITDTIQNWQTGDFRTRAGPSKLLCEAFGVEFWRIDIVAMLPTAISQPLGPVEPGNYAQAAWCRKELCAATGCDKRAAEDAILRHCRAGLIPSRCHKISWQIINRYGRENEEGLSEAVPEWFWEHCLDNPNTVLNWTNGRFAGRGTVDGDEYRAILTGVEFEVSAIVDIANEMRTARLDLGAKHSSDATDGPATSKGTGRRQSALWQPWIVELVAYVHDTGIPDGVGSQGQEELINAIAEALAKRGQEALGRATVQPVVQAVLDRLRPAGN